MRRFFADFEVLDRFTLSFDSQHEPPRCPHCSKSDPLVSHGVIYKQRSSHEREAVGKRVLCSNRYQHNGCGRTFSLYVASVLPRRCYSAAHLFAFLSALLLGMAVESAYRRATGQNDWLRPLEPARETGQIDFIEEAGL